LNPIKHGLDRAHEILQLTIKDQKTLFKTMDIEDAAIFLPYIDATKRVAVFMRFSAKQHILILNEMASDDALELLRLLPEKYALKLINQSNDKEEYQLVLSFEDDEIGAYVTFDFIQLYDDMTVKEATKKVILEAPDVEILSEVLITNRQDTLLGTIPLKTLLKAKGDALVHDFIEPVTHIDSRSDISEAISLLESSKQKMLPVIDNDMLLGMITLDDAIDLYQESSIEDLKKFSALPNLESNQLIKNGLKRLPWLLSLLLLFIPIMVLTNAFEFIIAQFVILMLFQPLILGSAGNVATQTLGVMLQSLSKQDYHIKHRIRKELTASILIGITMGLIAFLLTYGYGFIIQTNYQLNFALTVGISLGLTLMISPLIAILIPLMLKRIGQDPAIASGPFITTLIDISALVIYFVMATLLIGGMML
jgi:magnesium transporter